MKKKYVLSILFFTVMSLSSSLLAQSVEIVRDEYWIPHIVGDTPRECAYGLARAMCEDHPEAAIDNILAIRGKKAAAYGIAFLEEDVRVRAIRMIETGTQYFAGLPPEVAAYFDGFALGVNDHFREHPEDVPPEVKALQLTPVTGAEIFSSKRRALRFQWWMFLQEAGALIGKSASLERYRVTDGSNQWAIAPFRTRDGATYLLADPHQDIRGDSPSYEAHVLSRDGKLDFEGRFGLGTPIGSLGHNRFVAFSGTHNKPDYADAYIVTLDPNTSGAYLLDGRSKPFTIWQETFQVAGAPDTTLTFRSSRDHGIMIKSLGGGKVLMAKMEVMDSPPAGLQNYRKLTARSVEDFRAAMALHQSFKGNSAAIDVQGNIYYVYRARVHERPDPEAARSGPLDGSTSATLWGDLIPFETLPSVFNPPSGYLQNCNNSPWYVTDNPGFGRADVPLEVHKGDFLTIRGRRVLELIAASADTFDLDYARRMALDTKILAWDSVRTVLQLALQESANSGYARQQEADSLADILFDWDAVATRDSEAMSLFVEWHLLLTDQFSFLDPGAIDASQRRLMVEKLVEAGDLMASYYGTIHKPWGQIHGLERGGVWYPISGGGGNELEASRHGAWEKRDSQHRFMVKSGNNFMMVIRLKPDESPQARAMKPFGQSIDPNSPHYADLTVLYSADSLRKTWYDESEFRSHAEKIETFIVTAMEENGGNDARIPQQIGLSQNYPNPFNPATAIRYSLPRRSHVALKVFDLLGREVAVLVDEKRPAGEYVAMFDAARLVSGVYFFHFTAGQFTQIRKAILMK